MKQFLLISILILSCCIHAVPTKAQAPVNNGGFENWESVPLAFVPDDWKVELSHEFANQVNTQVNESTDGTYSLKLTTVDDPLGTEPYLGFAVLGEVGESGPSGGIPWTEDVDQLQFDAKYDIQSGDIGYAMVQIYDNSGILIGGGTMSFTGTQTTVLATETLDISYTGTPAEIMIGFVSSDFQNTANAVAGSWMQVDNVRLFNGGMEVSTPIPNYSFENWSEITIDDPTFWTSSNMELSVDNTPNVEQSTNAYNGTYAAQLTNLQMTGYVMVGALSYGDKLWDGQVAYTDKPQFFTGAYNYMPVGNDYASIYISFYDNSAQNVAGNYLDINATTGYKTFVLPLYWDPANNDPVTTSIGVIAGQNQVAGSVLLVDDFKFENGSMVNFTVHDNSTPTPNFIMGATINIDSYVGTDGTTDLNGDYSLPLPDGTYNITVTHPDYDNYTGTLSVNGPTNKEIVMSLATGIKSPRKDPVSIFPNPASETLYFSKIEGLEKIEVINMNGSVVKEIKSLNGLNSINISDLAPGKYIISISTNQNVCQKTIIVNR